MNVVHDGDYQYEQEIPLGLATIAAFMREQGYRVTIQQCFASRGESELEKAADVKADLYGFQLNMVNYLSVEKLSGMIKSRNPGSVIVVGGPFLVSLAEEIFKRQPLLNFAVIGEGEYTLLELVQSLESGKCDFAEIEGLLWRDTAGALHKNGLRGLIENLDTVPFPARDFLETARRDPKDGGVMESIRVITSRGCAGRCSFCCVNFYNKVQKGKVWRGRSPRHVVDELEMLSREFGARLFNFSDSSFEDPGHLGKKRSADICREIIRRKLPISFKIYMRCETMKTGDDLELLRLYKQAGVDVIILGVESGSDHELTLYGKNSTMADNIRTLKILREMDTFYVFAGFIMFGPNTTTDILRQNIEFLHDAGFADNLYILSNTLMLIRDSKLYEMLLAEGRVIESGNFWELPKYTFMDRRVERVARHWQNIISRFPNTKALNTIQINTGNLVARMTNPMNAPVLEALHDEFAVLKSSFRKLSEEFGRIQKDYFLLTLDLVGNDCADHVLLASAEEFFGKRYGEYLPMYRELYEGFLQKITGAGFGLSGLVFEHFYSAVTVKETARI